MQFLLARTNFSRLGHRASRFWCRLHWMHTAFNHSSSRQEHGCNDDWLCIVIMFICRRSSYFLKSKMEKKLKYMCIFFIVNCDFSNKIWLVIQVHVW